MGREQRVNEEMNQMLLALSCRDLKKVMSGVMGPLEVFSQELGRTSSHSIDAMKVEDHIAYMQFAASNLMDNLNELLVTLKQVCPDVENVVGQREVAEPEYGPEAYTALRERWISELSRMPPHILHM